MIEKYYEEELRYLYDSGRQFAKAHPDQARFLNIDALGDRDPHVERLFEGFAFLAARIREKLDDSFPEFSGGMIDLLWPHLQQEIPSTTMVEFKPREGYLSETRTLGRGTELLSKPAGPDNVICTFSSTQAVALNPVALTAVEKKVDTKGKGSLVLRFRIEQGISWPKVRLEPVRLYLHAEMPLALALHDLLTRHVASSTITFDDGGTHKEATVQGQEAVTAAGFEPDQSLLPCDSRAYWGYALLLEYFVYPEKFLFVDLHGFDRESFARIDPAPSAFSVAIAFDRGFPDDKPFGVEHFKLFCAPAVNLFRRSTEPVPTAITKNEYQVVADIDRPDSFCTHSVTGVTGVHRSTGERFDYCPLHSFRGLQGGQGRTYTTRFRHGFSKKRELILSIDGRTGDHDAPGEENLSVEAYFTNGSLARDEIREGDVAFPGSDFPSAISFSNITRPTLPCPPPPDEKRWTFLAHLGSTYSSMATAESLKSFLRLYEWSGSEGRRQRIESIKDVEVRPAEALLDGSMVRGIRYTVTIEEAAWRDIDDLHLFGRALASFFTHYVSINSFLELEIHTRPSGRTLVWESLRGKKCPM
ncbi:MAG: type VI secretion system baseplate subunit TssF [Chitinispirillaceae bacterium]|nr:type VI secretion system baseplate subunit TssF [Chitinispirillaceae bacterium]